MALRVQPKFHPRKVLGYFTLKANDQPHTRMMRLHGRDSNVVVLVVKTVDLMGM